MIALLVPALARAEGVPVSPDTPSAPPASAPAPAPRVGATPPACVDKILETVYEHEKTYFGKKKAYSDSLFEIRALSAIGLGCPGWDLPAIQITYGGSGYTAVTTEASSGNKWIVNQDKTLSSEVKKIEPIEPPAPPKKK